MADFNITFDKDGNVLEGNVGFSWTFGTCQGKKNVTYSSTEPSWLTVEAYQGRNDAILITAKPSTQVGARNGDVTINLNGKDCTTIAVTQNGTGCECDSNTFGITTSSPIQIGADGGALSFIYRSDENCIYSVTEPTVSPSQADEWITNLALAANKTVTGTVISNGATDQRSATITIKGVMKDSSECSSYIEVKQAGIACSCDNLNIDCKENTIPTEGLDVDSILATYKIVGGCDESLYTATLTEDTTEYLVTLLNGNVYLKKKIPPIGEGVKSKRFVLQFKYNNVDCERKYCVKTQDSIPCDCEHADYFIKALKTTFDFYGTNGQTMLVGSGKTSCGSIRLLTNSDMVEGRELTVEPLTGGEFNILANILPTTETRGTGIVAELYDEGGTLLDSCTTHWELLQTLDSCECGMWPSHDGVLGLNHDRVFIDGEYWIDTTRPNLLYVTFKSPSSTCKAGYVDYDESIWVNSIGRHVHWINYDTIGNITLHGKAGVADDGPIHTTVTITWYVDVMFDGEEMIAGWPCTTHEYKFVIWDGTCSCAIECGYYWSIGNDISIDAEAGTLDGIARSYCDDTEYRYELVFPWGVEPWATVEADETNNKRWILTYSANQTTSKRPLTIKAIPIVDGVECDCSHDTATILQDYDECVNCEVAMQEFRGWDRTVTPSCDQNIITDIAPSSYSDKCGYDVYKIVAARPESALTYAVEGVNRFMTITGLSEQTEDWVFTFESFIGVNRNRKWVPLFEDCKVTNTLTVKKCIPQGCSCQNRHTDYSFTKSPRLLDKYPSGYGELVIGVVGEISPEDTCLEYNVVSTQQDYVTFEGIDPITREAKVLIKDIGGEAKVDVSLTINLREKDGDKLQCASGPPISFLITNSDE